LALDEVDKILVTNERDIGALCLKGQILRHYAPTDAIQVYEKVLELDQEGSKVMNPIEIGQRRFQCMIDFAEVHQAVGNWQEARFIYGALIKQIKVDYPGTKDGLIYECRLIFTGVAKCLYQLGEYGHAVKMGKDVLLMGRSLPGVHKLVALPQLALGQVEAARITMRRAILHEAPWDDENRQKNIAFLEECLRDETTKKGGV
jgi:tetratricopeptide (TPR) repeat protein